MKAVDIIVPIYNAYDDLVKCIASVKRHTDLTTHRLILINDCSPDERILPLLRSEEAENIIVIDNEVNGGFSNNVNKGMLYSEDRDVILLNSDTIVTERWIEKIVACAYSKPEIGSVTPMSNCATLCSYPVFCQDSLIPENWTVDSLARVIERCSMKIYPRITVAVGFCMFIKRETIEKVGLFDAKTFERGYGEENDFCNRAEQLGYIHVMCDDTFIYHKGTASFLSEQKKELIEAHEKILMERYPAQMIKNSKYCQENLDQYIRENIHIYTKGNPNKKNIMYVVQSDFRKDAFDNMGGTQFHVRDLTMNLKDEFNVYVVARDRDYLRVTLYSGEEELALKYYIGEKDGYPRIHDTDLYRLFKNILCAFEINLLHVHHIHGLCFDVFDAAKELHIPVIATMHDFFYACPSIKLLNTEKVHCGGNCGDTKCSVCLQQNAGMYVPDTYLEEWRAACKHVFEICEKLVVPSFVVKDVYTSLYPEIADKITIIEHGLEIKKEDLKLAEKEVRETQAVQQCYDALFSDKSNPYAVNGWAYLSGVNSENINIYLEVTNDGNVDYILCTKGMRQDVASAKQNNAYIYCGFAGSVFKPEYLNKEIKIRVLLEYKDILYTNGQYASCVIEDNKVERKYNVAFLGGMVPEKGSQKALEMICNSSEEIRWHIFGTIGDKELADLEQDNLVKHGTYRQQDIPNLLAENKIDLVCILSIIPETFCYTLSEAVTCNIPVLATAIGASGERVKRHGYGWTVPVDYTGAQMSEYVYGILTDTKEYTVKKEIVRYFNEISLADMASRYANLYSQYQKPFTSTESFDVEWIYKGLGIPAGIKNTPYQLVNGAGNGTENFDDVQMNDYLYTKNLEEQLNSILNSRAYRLIEKIRNSVLFRLVRKIIK